MYLSYILTKTVHAFGSISGTSPQGENMRKQTQDPPTPTEAISETCHASHNAQFGFKIPYDLHGYYVTLSLVPGFFCCSPKAQRRCSAAAARHWARCDLTAHCRHKWRDLAHNQSNRPQVQNGRVHCAEGDTCGHQVARTSARSRESKSRASVEPVKQRRSDLGKGPNRSHCCDV